MKVFPDKNEPLLVKLSWIDGYSKLHLAVLNNNFNEVRKLLKNKYSEINEEVKHPNLFAGHTALHLAMAFKYNKIAEELLNHSSIDRLSSYGYAPLHHAAEIGNISMIETLIINNADLNIKSKSGETPLEIAILNNQLESVDCLLKYNAKDFMQSVLVTPPLHYSACLGRTEVIKIFVKYNFDLNTKNSSQQTILHISSIKGHNNLIKYLLKIGIDIYSVDIEGRTALHVAVKNNQIETAKILIKYGKHELINFKDMLGFTALHCIVDLVSPLKIYPFLKCLIDNSADVNIENDDGNTILHLLAGDTILNSISNSSYKESVHLLVKNGAKLNMVNKDNYTPLDLTIKNDNEQMAKILVFAGAKMFRLGSNNDDIKSLLTLCKNAPDFDDFIFENNYVNTLKNTLCDIIDHIYINENSNKDFFNLLGQALEE